MTGPSDPPLFDSFQGDSRLRLSRALGKGAYSPGELDECFRRLQETPKDGILPHPPEALPLDREAADLVGSRLGPYRLVSLRGLGVRGPTYLAEAPDQRRWAVKILHHPGYEEALRGWPSFSSSVLGSSIGC